MHERISIQTYVGLEMGKVSLTPGESGEDHQPGKQIQPIGIQERQISHTHVCVCVYILHIYLYISYIICAFICVYIFYVYKYFYIIYVFMYHTCSNHSVLREMNPEYSLEGLMLRLKLQYFGHLMRTADSLEKSLMLGKIES